MPLILILSGFLLMGSLTGACHCAPSPCIQESTSAGIFSAGSMTSTFIRRTGMGTPWSSARCEPTSHLWRRCKWLPPTWCRTILVSGSSIAMFLSTISEEWRSGTLSCRRSCTSPHLVTQSTPQTSIEGWLKSEIARALLNHESGTAFNSRKSGSQSHLLPPSLLACARQLMINRHSTQNGLKRRTESAKLRYRLVATVSSNCPSPSQVTARGKALYQLVLCFTDRLPSRIDHQVRC